MSKNKQKIINEAPKIKPLGDNKIAESRGKIINSNSIQI
jgi:hypothetical protein